MASGRVMVLTSVSMARDLERMMVAWMVGVKEKKESKVRSKVQSMLERNGRK